MIEIKFLAEDIEGIRDFGITLLQNDIIYRMRRKGNFIIFEMPTISYDRIVCTKTRDLLSEEGYCYFSLQFEREIKPFEFKAFSLKIY